ncbi:Uncharacterised protein [BD1-7 clade bacterium]|uniref:Chalcone isomerase domain-containing protein n=1 Tax=BD1-7 clade bacterium TaxID=2029982 RepID=A0A5S9NZC0_9GAMM|nr:Uncharacterised protein [BD1-7 clade bacterium]CAA0096072.1 Uncharacterised protein [BD1-7 clade bacterium]
MIKNGCCALFTLFLLISSVAVQAKLPLQLVGEARLQIMFWPIYESRLLNADGVYNPHARPVRLEITYLRDFKAQALIDRTSKEWGEQGVTHPSEAAWLQQLQALWPDIAADDELAIEIDTLNHSTFYFNGRRLGKIQDPAFGNLFLGIWLSPSTSQPDQRLALIGSETN